MILVTGAGGKTGQAIVGVLAAHKQTVRALVRRREQARPLRSLGAADVVVEDMLSRAGVARAMASVRAVYWIAPNIHPEEGRMGRIAIAAARAAGVRRFVYHSVLHPQTRAMPHHWQKLGVEERLFESGLDFTVLQPAPYMQNVLPYWDTVLSEGAYRVPYGEGAALSLVDLEDVAEAAARVLTGADHEGATYELAGPEALSPSAIARALSRALGRPVEAETVEVSEWVDRARAGGLEEYSVAALSKMFRYYDSFGLSGSPRVLQWLLRRRPTTFGEFLDRARRAGSGAGAPRG